MSWSTYWEAIYKIRHPYKAMQKMQWTMYKSLLDKVDLKTGDSMEIGAGSGYLSMKMNKRLKGKTLMIDISPEAKKLFRKFYGAPENVEYRIQDIFESELKPEFDVVSSDGLIEHFKDDVQIKLMEIHRDASRKYVIFFVPRPSPQYNISSTFMKTFGLWHFGYEKPMTLEELTDLCNSIDLEVVGSTKGVWECGVICEK